MGKVPVYANSNTDWDSLQEAVHLLFSATPEEVMLIKAGILTHPESIVVKMGSEEKVFKVCEVGLS